MPAELVTLTEYIRRVIAAGVDPKKAINKDMYTFPEETPLHTACRYVIDPSPTPIFPRFCLL